MPQLRPQPPPPPRQSVGTRIPQASDFAHLSEGPHRARSQALHVSLVFPEVVETTTSIMLLFHGFGDSDVSFARLAKNMNLPGVLGIAVRGVEPLPPVLLAGGGEGGGGGEGVKNWMWGDDYLDGNADPGFDKARRLVLDELVMDTLVGRLGWRTEDILLFGFGQGGSVALGLASRLRDLEGGKRARVVDVTDETAEGKRKDAGKEEPKAFKGAISIGGPLPPSLVPTLSSREKARTPVLVCHGRGSEDVDGDAMEYIRQEIGDVREVVWSKGRIKGDDGMPRNREEMLPVMKFLAERLAADQWS